MRDGNTENIGSGQGECPEEAVRKEEESMNIEYKIN